jgi:hypothetical protein
MEYEFYVCPRPPYVWLKITSPERALLRAFLWDPPHIKSCIACYSAGVKSRRNVFFSRPCLRDMVTYS